MANPKITICACSSRSIIDRKRIVELTTLLKRSGCDPVIIPDMCKSVQNNDTDTLEMISQSVVIACYPRAVESLLAWRGVSTLKNMDSREDSVEESLANLSLSVPFKHSSSVQTIPNPVITPLSSDEMAIMDNLNALPKEEGIDAWFPVIDKKRCTNCRKCHDFCLFGVYGVEGKEVQVVNPKGCKNNCPACARVCPSRAIIFPKYEKSPINGGEALEEEFDAASIDKMYNERLKYRLQQRRATVSLLKKSPKNDL